MGSIPRKYSSMIYCRSTSLEEMLPVRFTRHLRRRLRQPHRHPHPQQRHLHQCAFETHSAGISSPGNATATNTTEVKHLLHCKSKAVGSCEQLHIEPYLDGVVVHFETERNTIMEGLLGFRSRIQISLLMQHHNTDNINDRCSVLVLRGTQQQYLVARDHGRRFMI